MGHRSDGAPKRSAASEPHCPRPAAASWASEHGWIGTYAFC